MGSRSDITGRTLKAIRESCPNLYRLDISDCHEITESAVVDTVMEMQQLRLMQLKYCRGISTQMQLFVAQLLAGRALGLDDGPPMKMTSRSPQRPSRARSGTSAPSESNDDNCSRRNRPSLDTALTPRTVLFGDEQITSSSSSSRSTAASSSSTISPSYVDRSRSMPSASASAFSS